MLAAERAPQPFGQSWQIVDFRGRGDAEYPRLTPNEMRCLSEESSSSGHAGFLAIGPGYPGVLSDDGLVVLFTHPGDAQWTEVVPVEYLEEAPDAPKPRHRGK